MFILVKPNKEKKDYQQFTITLDKNVYMKAKDIAQKNSMSFHGFVISLILTYIKYSKF